MNRTIDKIALALGVVLLAFGPLVLSLARADDYGSTSVVSFDTRNPSASYLPDPRGLLAGPVTVKDVQRRIAQDVPWIENARDLPKYVRVTETGEGKFAVVARGPGNEEARQLADAAAPELRDAAEVGAAFTQPLQVNQLKAALRRDNLSASQRAELRTRLEQTETSVDDKQAIFSPDVSEGTLESEKIGDRVLGTLPGDRSFRPNLLWVTVAGFLLAGALALWALALGPMRSGRDGSAPG